MSVGSRISCCLFRLRSPPKHHIDYPVAIWAVHRLGGVISYRPSYTQIPKITDSFNRGANPDFTETELLYQLQETKASVLITHPESLPIALKAARAAGLSSDRIVLFNAKDISHEVYQNHETVGGVLEFGLRNKTVYTDRILGPGEGRTKLAFLSFSSGTTGRPKV